MNENVEQAEQFIISNFEFDFVSYLCCELTCKNSWLNNKSDKAKTAFSNMTQFLEKKFIELSTLDNLTNKELERLRYLLCFYVHYGYVTKIQDFLSKKPDLVVPLYRITVEFFSKVSYSNYPDDKALQSILETHIPWTYNEG